MAPSPGAAALGRGVARRADFVDWCLELLSPLGTTRAKAMFGGHGLYVDERFVAIVADEVLYLKADAESAPAFAAAGGAPFTYTANGRTATMSYWRVPAEAMESAAAMAPWGRLAVAAAVRAAAGRARTCANGKSAGGAKRRAAGAGRRSTGRTGPGRRSTVRTGPD